MCQVKFLDFLIVHHFSSLFSLFSIFHFFHFFSFFSFLSFFSFSFWLWLCVGGGGSRLRL